MSDLSKSFTWNISFHLYKHPFGIGVIIILSIIPIMKQVYGDKWTVSVPGCKSPSFSMTLHCPCMGTCVHCVAVKILGKEICP